MASGPKALPMAKARRPRGAGAVMAAHAPAEVEADDPLAALHRKLNYFPTPPWAARAGGELIQRVDPGRWTAWEPACGEGHCAYGLEPYFAQVFASDIHDHGSSRQAGTVFDFTLEAGPPGAELGPFGEVDWIVTNPPFALAEAFVQRGLERARRGVAMLCRMSWLESAGRYPLFFGETPLAVLGPFSERVPMQLGSWDPQGSTATGYAWFVWLKDNRTVFDEKRAPVILPIGPGTKARLTRPEDARLFGGKAAMPLFEGVGA